MPIVTTRCVILQTYRYSDTSKILRLMTRDHGPRSAIAKGALRPRSKFGGLLEPFAEGEATLYLKEDRDLHTLSEFDLVRERQALGRDLVRFAGASVACELVMRLAPEERDRGLYGALVAGLDALGSADAETAPSVSLGVIWRVVRVLGFAPDLARCVGCGRSFDQGERSSGEGEGVRFDHAAGGLVCADCGGGAGSERAGTERAGTRRARTGRGRTGRRRTLSPEELATLRALVAGRATGRPPDPGQASLLRDFIRYHLAEGLHLRSLDFLDAEALA